MFRSNRVFVFSSLAALISYSVTCAVAFVLSLFLQYIKGLSPEMAGMVLMVQPVIQAGVSSFAGRWPDRIEARRLATVGMALIMLGLVGLSLLGA